MVDMSLTIAPKSDQLNADDLIGGDRTIKIVSVNANPGSAEQPVSIYYDGSSKPYKPCKSMRRVMVQIWGADASQYVGRSMTLYRDPKVSFGGMQVGGIRISHMSHIEHDVSLVLTASRAKRTPYKVRPLAINAAPQAPSKDYLSIINNADSVESLRAAWPEINANWSNFTPEMQNKLLAAKDARKAALTQPAPATAPSFDNEFED